MEIEIESMGYRATGDFTQGMTKKNAVKELPLGYCGNIPHL